LKHIALRQAYLENLAMSIAEQKHPFLATEGDSEALAGKAAATLQNLIKRGQKRRAFTRISNVLDPNSSTQAGLARIDVPASDARPFPNDPDPKTWEGPWTSITNPDDIVSHVCSATVRQYNQATLTPFVCKPLVNYLGLHGEKPSATALVNGILPPTDETKDLPLETVAILEVLSKTPTKIPFTTKSEITAPDFIGTYKACKESTSSSSLGSQVGHYKAILDDPELVALHASMMSLPHMNGFFT